MRVGIVALLFVLLGDLAVAQREDNSGTTRRTRYGLIRGGSVPSGAAVDLDVILRDTDVIVRGVVGNPQIYLSDDQTTILSDYAIAKPRI